jgi:hypothetical protein
MAQPANNPIARLFVKAVIRATSRWVRESPRAADSTLLHRSGPDALRILLIGDGNAVGYAVLSHEVGFGGFLASRIAALTGRGVDLEVMAQDGMTAIECTARLAEIELSRYDGIIVNIGLSDVLTMRSSAKWQFDLGGVLDQLHDSRIPAFVVSIPIASDDGKAPGLILGVIRARAELFNRITAANVEKTNGSQFVALASLVGRSFAATPGGEYYAEIADQVAPTVALSVVESVRRKNFQDEGRRQRALDAIHIVESADEDRFDAIVADVQRLFAVPKAAITFIDRDRQWIKSGIGVERVDTARSNAICATTIQEDGLLVVEDASQDARFAELPGIGEGGVRFYAGYPLETRSGYRVGALCIMDTKVHSFSETDGVLLRDFALEAQRQLWAS